MYVYVCTWDIHGDSDHLPPAPAQGQNKSQRVKHVAKMHPKWLQAIHFRSISDQISIQHGPWGVHFGSLQGSKMAPKSPLGPQRHPNSNEEVSKHLSPNDDHSFGPPKPPKMVCKGTKMVPKWSQNVSEVIPK